MSWIIISIVLIVIVAVLAPFVVKAKINRALQKMDGYTGRIESVHLHLLAGKIRIINLVIRKGNANDPVVQIPDITIYFRLRQLFKRNLDLSILVNGPKISLVDDEVSSTSDDPKPVSIDPSSRLKEAIIKVMPFRVNAEVNDATIHYKKVSPSLELNIINVSVKVTDFSNHPDQINPCLIETTGQFNNGTAKIDIEMYPLEPTLTFDLNSELKSIDLVPFNDIIKTYGKVDVNTGTLDFFAEIAITNNSFDGYLKPILTNLDFIGIQDKNDSLLQKIWERGVALSAKFLMNTRDGQLATKIPIEGRLDDPHVNLSAAFAGLLRNAFFKALRPSLDDIISFGSGWSGSHKQKKV